MALIFQGMPWAYRRALGWFAVVLFVVAIVFPGERAVASVARALDLPELVRRADRVAVVTALDQRASWDRYGRIVTDVTVQIDELVKGDPTASRVVEIRSLGGTIGNIGMRVEGETALSSGERALLFLRRDAGSRLRAVGLSQGIMRIDRQDGVDWVQPGGRGLALQRQVGGQLTTAPPALLYPRRLDDVLTEIRGLNGSSE